MDKILDIKKQSNTEDNVLMEQENNPLHGITLEEIVTKLSEHYGWAKLGQRIKIQCFITDPTIKSSLKFLRRNLWAREKVEKLFIANKRLFYDK